MDALNSWLADRDYLAGRYDSERSFDYGVYEGDRDFDYNSWVNNRDYEYQQERDKVADAQWQKEFDESVRQHNESLALQRAQAAARSSGGGGGRSGGSVTLPSFTYNDIKSAYIQGTRGGASASERNTFLNDAVSAGYITKNEAQKIAGIYNAPTKKYTAVDQIWDRHG